MVDEIANLKELKLEQEPCEDCISRQAVLDALDNHKYSNEFCEEHRIDWSINLGMAHIVIDDLPSITPQSKIGHWRHYEGMLICSECGAEFYDDIMEYCGDNVPKCCPECGTRMVESEDKE